MKDLEIEKSKVTRLINAVTENQPYLRNGKAIRTSNFVYRWSTMSHITDMRGDLHAESSRRSSYHLQGAGRIVAAPLCSLDNLLLLLMVVTSHVSNAISESF